MIDTHCHLDRFPNPEAELALCAASGLEGLITPATGEASLAGLYELAARHPEQIRLAAGVHPERPMTPALWNEAQRVAVWIDEHHHELVAIGEIGLPFYSLPPGSAIPAQALAVLDLFLERAARWDLPVILHAVHSSAAPCLERLQAHGIGRAVFHWLKAPPAVQQQIFDAGYSVSVTPEIAVFPRDQQLAERFYPHRLLVETDAPEPLRISRQGCPSPRWVWDTLPWLAGRFDRSPRELEALLDANARTLFRL